MNPVSFWLGAFFVLIIAILFVVGGIITYWILAGLFEWGESSDDESL